MEMGHTLSVVSANSGEVSAMRVDARSKVVEADGVGAGAGRLSYLQRAHFRLRRKLVSARALARRSQGDGGSGAVCESANAEFLAVMSHEIRTPLNAMMGMLDLASGLASGAEQLDYLKRGRRNAEALLNLLNDLLDMSKVEAGQVVIGSEPFSPTDILEDVCESLMGPGTEVAPILVCDTPPGTSVVVNGDPARLRQVLFNLVGNAMKFTSSGEVVARLSIVSVTDDEIAVQFDIEDSGIGICADDLETVFDRFNRGGRETGRGGTGLGLSIVKSLVELMGGAISVTSEINRGSTFRVQLTYPRVSCVPHRPADLGVAVIIDDHRKTREVLARRMEAWGATALPCGTIAEALVALARRPSLIVVTAKNPRSICSDLPGLIREQVQGEKPAVIVLQGAQSESLRSKLRGYRLGTVQQPFTVHEFERVMKEVSGPNLPIRLEPTRVPEATACVGGSVSRLLLAEDNQDSRGFLVRVLQRAGYDVDAAPDGMVALEMAQRFRYDLILTDLQMPRMDGLQATRRIRAIEAASGRAPTPVIAVTAHALPEFEQSAREAGMNAFLVKPVRTKELLEQVKVLVDTSPVALVVDDDHASRLFAGRVLDKNGYRVIAVGSGAEAIEAVRAQRIGMMFVDMNLCDMHGADVVSSVRRLPSGRQMKIVALTGDDTQACRDRADIAGIDDMILKPARRRDLTAAIGGGSSTGYRLAEPDAGTVVHEPLPSANADPHPSPPAAGGSFDRTVAIDRSIADLALVFIARRRTEVVDCRKAVDCGEPAWDAVERVGHNIKGCSRSYGFPGLSQIGAAVEDAARSKDMFALAAAVADFEVYVAELLPAAEAQCKAVVSEGGLG